MKGEEWLMPRGGRKQREAGEGEKMVGEEELRLEIEIGGVGQG